MLRVHTIRLCFKGFFIFHEIIYLAINFQLFDLIERADLVQFLVERPSEDSIRVVAIEKRRGFGIVGLGRGLVNGFLELIYPVESFSIPTEPQEFYRTWAWGRRGVE